MSTKDFVHKTLKDLALTKDGLFKHAREAIPRLEQKLEDASAKATTAEAELRDTLLAFEEGSAPLAQLNKVRKTATEVKQVVADAEGSLAAARHRLTVFEEHEREKAAETAKQATIKLAGERGKLGAQVEKQAATLAASILQLQEMSAQVGQTYPGEIDPTACMIGPRDVFDAVREILSLHGIEVNGPFSQWELERRPSLVEKLETAKSYMEKSA